MTPGMLTFLINIEKWYAFKIYFSYALKIAVFPCDFQLDYFKI